MPRTLLEKCCVRIAVNFPDGSKILGSGMIVSNDETFYVVTAAHCLCDKQFDWKSITSDMIVIEYQNDYLSDHMSINTKGVLDLCHDLDWCIIEIENPSLDCDFSKVHFGVEFEAGEKVFFTGYQQINRNSKRCWTANIIQIADKNFRINLNDQSFEQGGNLGKEMASGLSGSGVYIIRGNSLYLIGHLLDVTSKIALNDDVNCCRFSNLKTKFEGDKWVNLSDLGQLKEWENNTEEKIEDADIQNWIDTNDAYFDNLLRKAKVLYSDSKATKIARERLIEFLIQEYKNSKIRGMGNFIEQFEKTAGSFEKMVKNDYTRDVKSSSEAKDLLIKLQTDFANHLNPLVRDNTNVMNLDLAKYKVTWWLLNCSFDFKEDEI